ncbi:MAG: HAD-IA family hydrolase [Woeseia sp.]|nr:HAD-IA family hydrolase [Woeseia sp.]NNL53929.1 HAD-IA family hydrolase [Woeseia sp.]
MSAVDHNHPQLLLLDYGGVLLHLNDPVETFGIGTSRADFNELWLRSPAVQAHENGKIGSDEFARRMVSDLQLPYSASEFIARFDAWPDRVPSTVSATLDSVPAGIECAILSNTNALHWQQQNITRDFGSRIARTFLSFETGFLKPEPQAFRHVLEQTGYAPTDVLFIDDNPLNIAAAGELGLRACLCPGVDALGAVLRAESLIE